MPRYELIISPALDGRTVRQAAMGGLHLSGGQFKRAKFHGALLLDGMPVLADRRVRTRRAPVRGCARKRFAPARTLCARPARPLRGCLFLDDRQTRAAPLLQLV